MTPAGDIDPGSLGDVENTGLLTAFCRAVESRSDEPLLADPWAEAVADRLRPALARSPLALHRRLAEGRLRDDLVAHIALRARQYDRWARAFAKDHPSGCVVNLGCGLDTRFRRIDDGRLRFFDLDLPGMIALKRGLVDETDRYRLVGASVLDHRWMDRVAADGGPFLFLAEGLLMYLPARSVKALVRTMRSRFPGSELAFETVNSVWLRPWLRWMVDVKMRKELGLGEGTAYRFGVGDGREIERWAPGIRLLEEWSALDEDEPRTGFIRRFRRWRFVRCTQWTLRYALGEA